LSERPDIGLAGDGNRGGEAIKKLRVHAGDEKVLRAEPTARRSRVERAPADVHETAKRSKIVSKR
jgi:hypothetical protein